MSSSSGRRGFPIALLLGMLSVACSSATGLLGHADSGFSGTDAGFEPDSGLNSTLDGGGARDAGDGGPTEPRDAGLDAGDAGPSEPLDAGLDAGDAGPYVVIADGGLYIGGQQTFLFGGELQYFRIHDPNFDAGITYAMWSETLDLMADAGMNAVSTYVPWDYHNTSQGVWDFTGAKDLGHFLSMACGRGFHVTLKPGPLITAEWPDGPGSFGAVPLWWKQAHPEALILNAQGNLWTYSPTGDTSQQQPTYLHPEYLAAVQDYYDHVLPIAQPYLGNCLVGLQIDNETNLYWADHFGSVDYSPTALAFYGQWLETKYDGGISTLNQTYGTSYTAFDQVTPPTSDPSSSTSDQPNNPWYADWYWAGQAYVQAYLEQLSADVDALGFGPNQILHLTNDSPFALTYGSFLVNNILLHNPPTKDPLGVATLDLYPKQDPTNGALQDQPFQADYFTRQWETHHLAGQPSLGFAYSAEMQGGFYSFPVLGPPDVQPAATDQLLARTVGHGLRGGMFYVLRGGTNADGSDYDFEAAIAEDGTPRPRYQVLQKWGAFLQQYGLDLQSASETSNSVAILDNAAYAAPQGGILDNPQLNHTLEQPGIYGWLMNAGIDAAILDAQTVSPSELQQYSVVFFQNLNYVDDATATLLTNYVQAGGLLVDFLWPGSFNALFQSSPATQMLSTQIFPAQPDGDYEWFTNLQRSGAMNATFGNFTGQITSCWYESWWTDPTALLQPFAWDQEPLIDTNGPMIGYVANDSLGKRVFLGTNVFSLYNREDYYGLAATDLASYAALTQWLVGLGGEAPIVSIAPQELVWSRRSRQRIYLFVVDDSGTGATQHIVIEDPTRLGLVPTTTYSVEELLSGESLGVATGAALATTGISVDVAGYGTAIIGLTPQ